jgi:hypothetical protein
MRERVVTIGQNLPLVGIVCEPDAGAVTNPSVAMILLNSGVIHRVGSCRLSVTLARALAEKSGLMSLRFDFSGIGDSEARRNTLTAAESAVDEVREVMDFLARDKGVKKFILYGLCSGAFAAYRTALKDERVLGIAQLDGYCYLSWKSYFYHYSPRIFSLERWVGLIKRLLGLKKTNTGVAASKIDSRFFEVPAFDSYPPRAEVTTGLDKLARRGLKMFNVFCGSEHYNYPEQFKDCFSSVSFGDNLTLLYLPHASHILAEPEDQQRVIKGIVEWVKVVAKP